MSDQTEKLKAEVARLTVAKDAAYAERNQVVALLARMARALGWRTGVRAAAPDLLAAAEAAEDWLSSSASAPSTSWGLLDKAADADRTAIARALRAAIAKAKGEQR